MDSTSACDELSSPTFRAARWVAAALAAVVLVSVGCEGAASLESARQRLERSDTAGAAIEAKRLLQDEPKSAAARFILGQALLAQGDLAGAEVELQRAQEFGHPAQELTPVLAELAIAQRKPDQVIERYGDTRFGEAAADARMLVQIATAYRDLGDLPGAEGAVSQALEQSPELKTALILRARLAAGRGESEITRRIVTEMLARDPADADVLLLHGDYLAQDATQQAQAVAAYRKALAGQPRLAQAHANLIALLLTQGDLAAAAEQARTMSKVLPGSALAAFYQTLVAYIQGDMPKVRDLSQRLLPAVGAHPQTLFLAGMAELRLGNLVQAETLLTRSVLALPKGIEPRRELAGLYVRLARPAAALETLKPLLDANTGDSGTWRMAGQAHAVAGHFQLADAAFARAAQLRPDDVRISVEIGKSLIARGQADDGLRQLKAAAATDATGVSADLALIAASMGRNDLPAALDAAKAMAVKQPTSPAPDLLRGRILLQAGDKTNARAAFEQALAKSPDLFAALENLANIDLSQNRPDAARQRYEGLLKRDPKSAPAMLALAHVARRSGADAAKAAAWLDKATQVDPRNAAVWRAALDFHRQGGEHAAGLARANAALAVIPDDAGLLLQAARAQLDGGDTQQAVSSLNRAAQLMPLWAEPHLMLAQIYSVTGKLSAAAQSAAKALELSPNNEAALRMSIAVALRDKRHAAAAQMVRNVQQRDPASALGWQLEGEMDAALGNWKTAAQALAKAQAKKETTSTAVLLHQALLKSGAPAEAAAMAEAFQRKHPTDTLFVQQLAEAAAAGNQWGQAAALYRRALKTKPDDPVLLNNLAHALVQQNDPAALDVAQSAWKAAPHLAEVGDTLAQALTQAHRYEDAVKAQSRVVDLAPQTERFRLRLAQLHLKAGDKSKAREQVEWLQRRRSGDAPSEELTRLLQQVNS